MSGYDPALMSPRLLQLLLSCGITVLGAAVLVSPAWSQRPPDAAAPIVVSTVRSVPAIQVVRLPGTVMAPRSSRLSSSIGGLVKEMPLALGDRVEAGELVIQLDDSLVRPELAQARAAVEEALLQSAEKSRLLRIGQNLAKRGMTSKDLIDARRADVQIAKAVVKKLRADEAGKRELLNRHRILAPFAGVVARRHVEVGEWVAPGTSIVELIADQDLQVDIALPQQFYAGASGDLSVDLRFDAFPGQTFSARPVTISPSSDPATRTFLMRVLPNVADARGVRLASGMSAQATLSLKSDGQVLALARDAVVRHADGRLTVWVVTTEQDKATVSSRAITPGETYGDNFTVKEGLQAGEVVVISGNESLRPGQVVKITNDPS